MNVDSKEKLSYVRHNFNDIKYKLINKKSNAEKHFTQLLTKANIYFFREKCNFKDGTRWCYYDFFIPYYRLYIEIDGSSHDNEKQKQIDKEKHNLVKDKNKYLVRFTNEEVLAMDSISIDLIIDKLVEQLRATTKKHKNRDFKQKFLNNCTSNYRQSIIDMRRSCKFDIDEDKKIYLYDHFIGEYFEFDNVFIAKLNTSLSINEIFQLADPEYKYKKSNSRRYVFGWTKAQCEMNVADTYW